MSTDGFVIAQPAGQRTLALRESYLSICDGDACEAHLLNAQERWYAYKLKVRNEARGRNKSARQGAATADVDEALWVRMSASQWVEELLGVYHEKTIRAKLTSLVGRGLLSTRANPKRGWDRTPQWLFNRAAVQEAVIHWEASRPAPDLDPSEADAEESGPQNHSEDGAESIRTFVREHVEKVPNGAGQNSESIRTNVRSNNTGILNRDLLQESLTGGEYNIIENARETSTPEAQASQIDSALFTTTITPRSEDEAEAARQTPSAAVLPPDGWNADASITDDELSFLFGNQNQANEESETVTSSENVPPAAPHDLEETRALLVPALGGQKKLNDLMDETPPGLRYGQRRGWITQITPERATQVIAEARKTAGSDNPWTYIIRALDKEVGGQFNRSGSNGSAAAMPNSYDPPPPPVAIDAPRPADTIEIGARWEHKRKEGVIVTVVDLHGPIVELDTGEQLMSMYLTKDYRRIHA